MKSPTTMGLLLTLVFLSGCVTPDNNIPQGAIRTRATLTAPMERVWPLVVSEVGEDYPIRVIEKDSGLIATDWVSLPAGFNNMNAGRWIYPPGGFLATWNGLRMNMKVMAVEVEGGKTRLTVNCHYEAFENNVQKTWIVANSSGAAETTLLEKIERRLAAAPATVAKVEPAKPQPAATGGKSPADALLELKKLLDAGAITQAEYDEKRKAQLEKL